MILLLRYFKQFNYCFWLYVLFVFIVSSCNYNPYSDENSVSIKIDSICNNSAQYDIIITNKANGSNIISIKTNKGFFDTESEIIDEIKKMQLALPDVPLEKIAWQYVIENIRYSIPYTEERWQHHPSLMLNSLGTGQCDDLASVLAFIWRDLGFESRVWSLNGHVVPEVFANGKWNMFDPSFKVYYLNYKKEVASVSEISEDASLVLNNTVSKTNNSFCLIMSKSTFLSELYTTKEDNYVNQWYDEKIISIDKQFYLPAQSQLQFPIGSVKYSNKLQGGIFPNFSFATAQIHDTIACKIKIPLVPYSISGSGAVIINGENLEIGSEELTTFMSTSKSFINEIVFPGNHNNVKIKYLINDNLLHEISMLSISCANTDSIQLNIVPSNYINTGNISCSIDSIMSYNYGLFLSNEAKINASFKENKKDNTIDKVKDIIGELIVLDTNTSKNEKATKTKLIYSHLDSLNYYMGNHRELFTKKINTPEIIIILMSYAECLNTNEMIILLSNS